MSSANRRRVAAAAAALLDSSVGTLRRCVGSVSVPVRRHRRALENSALLAVLAVLAFTVAFVGGDGPTQGPVLVVPAPTAQAQTVLHTEPRATMTGRSSPVAAAPRDRLITGAESAVDAVAGVSGRSGSAPAPAGGQAEPATTGPPSPHTAVLGWCALGVLLGCAVGAAGWARRRRRDPEHRTEPADVEGRFETSDTTPSSTDRMPVTALAGDPSDPQQAHVPPATAASDATHLRPASAAPTGSPPRTASKTDPSPNQPEDTRIVLVNRRAHLRVAYQETALLRWRGFDYTISTVDLSIGGIGCRIRPLSLTNPLTRLRLREDVTITLRLHGEPLDLPARVAWRRGVTNGLELGLTFHRPTDDQLRVLRAVIEARHAAPRQP